MIIFDLHELAMEVPDNWTDFDNNLNHYKELLCRRFNENLADKILKIIDYNWFDFAGEIAIVITVEGTKCLTWITNEFAPIECSEKVFPFDEKQIYPMRIAELRIYFKRNTTNEQRTKELTMEIEKEEAVK